MPLSEKAKQNKRKYTSEWKKANVKRINLEVSHDKYNQIKQATFIYFWHTSSMWDLSSPTRD